MTTIVSDGESMGCDGQITFVESIAETDCLKVHRLVDGSLVGFAGNTYNWEDILNFFNCKDEKQKWPEIKGYQDTLVLNKDGRMFLYDHTGRKFERTAPVAIGSGAQYALAAMDCGADVRAAIEVACKRDPHSSGTIRVIQLSCDEEL